MPEQYQIILQELIRRSNEESRRMRSIEQRLDTLDDKLNVLTEGTNERTKRINTKLTEMEVALRTLSNDVANIKANVERITKSMAKFAQKRDLKEVERMLDLLSPIRQEFVTKDVLEEELKIREKVAVGRQKH